MAREDIMNRKIIMWIASAALISLPALGAVAQDGPGPDNEEMEIGGPGRPDMEPGMRDPRGPGERDQRGFGEKDQRDSGGKEQREPGMKGKDRRPGMDRSFEKGRGGPDEIGPVFLEEDECLALIKKYDAAFGKKVEDLRGVAPAKYKGLMQMAGKVFGMAKMENDESVEKDAVRAMSLEFDTRELALKYGKASDADKKVIKETLTPKTSELFDLRNKGQELRIKQMERKIGDVKKDLASRRANKAKIVEQRVGQLTGETYGW